AGCSVARGAGDVVDHPEGDAGDDGRVVEVVLGSLDEVPSTPLTVRPVRIAAVPGADVENHRPERLYLDVERLAATCREVQHRSLRMARARPVLDLHFRPAELLDATVRPDARGVVERAEAIGQFL